MFCVGLRNAQSADIHKIEALILDTLKNIIDEGFDAELIEGILHQVEFHGKEITRGSYPFGITLMGLCSKPGFTTAIRSSALIFRGKLKASASAGPPIRKYFKS